MSNFDFDTVIVGAGFAGSSVAHELQGSNIAVIDRGEPFDISHAYKKMDFRSGQVLPGHLDPVVDAEARVFASKAINNQVELPLSFLTSNVYSYMQGGISNWWGGYSARITPATFMKDGEIAWPFSYEELDPYYQLAEKLLRVHGDPTADNYHVFGEMPGSEYWRNFFKDIFPRARVTPEAKNITDKDGQYLGLCLGNGHCAICGNDAKARPANVFPTIEVFGNTRVNDIVFEGKKAVAVRGFSNGEDFEITAKNFVIAAGGIENVALLKRSILPLDVPDSEIGARYQDHTTCEVLGVLPKPYRHYHLGAEGAIEIPELSGYFHGIEVKTLMLPVPPNVEHTVAQAAGRTESVIRLIQMQEQLEKTGRFYLQMEIPPEWGLRLRSKGDSAFIYTMPYLRHRPILDAVVLEVIQRMLGAGIRISSVVPYHHNAFGGHHYSGTTAMSNGKNSVVDDRQKLIGTENVYLNGGSVIPRCGGSGPTLTIVALGLRLGHWLRDKES